MSYSEAYYNLSKNLKELYSVHEAEAIAHEAMNFITKQSKLDRIIHKDRLLNEPQLVLYKKCCHELLAGRPLQYVCGTTLFMGLELKVNEAVLIPRPETEELVHWIIEDEKKLQNTIKMLDIGTGSGCIALALKKQLPETYISAIDLSNEALTIAKENSLQLGLSIHFQQLDILDTKQWALIHELDIIVSNPPYICPHEARDMHSNVKDYEPHLALFVSNEDPLQFYKTIAAFGLEKLNTDGRIYCEIHQDHAVVVQNFFITAGYKNVEIKKDLNGHDRMIKACLQ